MKNAGVAAIALCVISTMPSGARGQEFKDVSPRAKAPPGPAPPEDVPTMPPPRGPQPTLAPVSPMMGPDGSHHRHGAIAADATYPSPGLAVALSLQPLPIDLGNLYAENLGWGIAYTAIETSLAMPMMWLAGRHMDHGGIGDRAWSNREQLGMMGVAAGYVAVKLIAGLHAGYAARELTRRVAPRWYGSVMPSQSGAVASARLLF